MRKIKNYKFCRESEKRRIKRGRENSGWVLIIPYRRRQYIAELGCGGNDDVYFWQQSDSAGTPELIVLSINTQMGYCGLELFVLGDEQPDDISPMKLYEAQQTDDTLFLQSTEEIDHALGKDALDNLLPVTIARRLLDLIEDGGCTR